MATMREITLKKLTVDGILIDYRQMLLDIMRSPRDPQKGVDDGEMEMLLDIRKQIREAPVATDEKAAAVLVTEAHFREIEFRVGRFQPAIALEEIRDFKTDIKESKSVEVQPVQTA